MTFTAKAPGKLFIVGEYAVTASQPAVIAAIDQFLTVSVSANTQYFINSTQFEQPITFNHHNEKTLPYISSAIQIVEKFVNQAIPVSITITSQLDHNNIKYGLGSSGALSVALIKALLAFYNKNVSLLTIYKLAVLANLEKNGSYGDIASSTVGGIIHYQAPDKHWLTKMFQSVPLDELIAMPWKNLIIEPLELPKNCQLLIGWTQTPYSTDDALKQVTIDLITDKYHAFLQNSRTIVNNFITATKQKDVVSMQKYLNANRKILQNFEKQSHLKIETPLLKKLCDLAQDYHIAAKTSGAGGGDCGIALAQNKQNSDELIKQWQAHDITYLNFKIAPSFLNQEELNDVN